MKTALIDSKLFGVGRAEGRRAVYSETHKISTAWLPRQLLGDSWVETLGTLFDKFLDTAASILREFGGIEKTSADLLTLASTEVSGAFERQWNYFHSYKPAAINRAEFLSDVRAVGDKEYYAAVLTGESEVTGSDPVRAVPVRCIFRALSKENRGHGLPDHNWIGFTREMERAEPPRKEIAPAPPPASTEPAKPVKRAATAGIGDYLRGLFKREPDVSNARAYDLAAKWAKRNGLEAPKNPSIRRTLNSLRKG